MRLLHVYHHARGDDFARLQPDLTPFSMAILQVALRLSSRELDPPTVPVIAHTIADEAMVWVLEAPIPTLVRPTRWIDGPPARVELATDVGPYLTQVFTTQQALAACWRLCPPQSPRTSRTVSGAADLLRAVYLELNQLVHEPMDPQTVEHLLASLTVCAQLLPAVLQGVEDAIGRIADDSHLVATSLPDADNPYGDPSAAAACLGAERQLQEVIARTADLADPLAGAHQYLFRVRRAVATTPRRTAGSPPTS
jgi:hypothetical protein